MMKYMKLISFIGQEKADFAYYISVILKRENKAILVIDNSENGDLYSSVVRNDEEFMQERICELENIVFARQIRYNAETFEKFDYVICYTGYAAPDEIVLESDILYIMPDYSIQSLNKVREHLEQIEITPTGPIQSVIMRDFVTDKITDKSVAHYLGINEEQITGHIELEPGDAAKYISFNYNGRQSINGLSQTYTAALTYIVTQITGAEDKWVKKLMKKA